jgi:hypothetical protein
VLALHPSEFLEPLPPVPQHGEDLSCHHCFELAREFRDHVLEEILSCLSIVIRETAGLDVFRNYGRKRQEEQSARDQLIALSILTVNKCMHTKARTILLEAVAFDFISCALRRNVKEIQSVVRPEGMHRACSFTAEAKDNPRQHEMGFGVWRWAQSWVAGKKEQIV